MGRMHVLIALAVAAVAMAGFAPTSVGPGTRTALLSADTGPDFNFEAWAPPRASNMPELNFQFACFDLEAAMKINSAREGTIEVSADEMARRMFRDKRCGAAGILPEELESASKTKVRGLIGYPYPAMSQQAAAWKYNVEHVVLAPAQAVFLPHEVVQE